MAKDEKQGDDANKKCNPPLEFRDLWRIIALKLERRSLYKLICAWRWFATTMIADDSVWKELLIRDLRVTIPEDGGLNNNMEGGGITWKEIYTSVFGPAPDYNPIHISHDPHIAGARLGGLIMSPNIWLGLEFHDWEWNEAPGLTTQVLQQHGIFVPNLLPGLWVADVYYASCPACDDCGWTKTIMTLWHSKLHLLDEFENLCPNTLHRVFTLTCSGIIVDESADDMDLARLYIPGVHIRGLDLEYIRSEKGLAFEFIANEMFHGKEYEAELRLTKDGDTVVAVQIEHIVAHPPRI